MASIDLWEYQPVKDALGKVHADPGGGLTCCGCICSGSRWVLLGSGSMDSVDCGNCRRVLIAAGDLSA